MRKKAERAKQLAIFKTTRGYDPTKWIEADATIRSEEKLITDYQHIELVQPTKGKHRFMHCQDMYEQVHAFLEHRKWLPVSSDDDVSGITWIELFALFDLFGGRTEKGQHQKDAETTKRVEKRKLKSICARDKKDNLTNTMAVTKPKLDEEIKLFKAIVRHVFRHEVRSGKAKWFRMDSRANLRRLGNLGVSGHQPALMFFCHMTREEKIKITEAILKQKVANNKKADAIYAEHSGKGRDHTPSDTIILRIARIAYGSTVKWKRETKADEVGSHLGSTYNDEGDDIKYHSRVIACTRCGAEQETKDKQL